VRLGNTLLGTFSPRAKPEAEIDLPFGADKWRLVLLLRPEAFAQPLHGLPIFKESAALSSRPRR
jgi:hypothetical protein